METYAVTIRNTQGFERVYDTVPASNEQDARDWMRSCCGNGWEIVSINNSAASTPAWHNDRATGRQVDYLKRLGVQDIPNDLTKQQASDMIEAAKGRNRCHYCGMPATTHGFFGEWTCPECR